jgi:hypothetical protein
LLNDKSIYVTPARPIRWDYILAVWKMAQDRYRLFAVQFGAAPGYGSANDLALRHRERLRLGASEASRDELLATLQAAMLAAQIRARGVRPETLALFYTMRRFDRLDWDDG